MDNAAWGALALALAVLAGIWTRYAFRNRGVASGVRGAALTILPIAAYLTHTLRMFGRVGDAIGDWAVGLVFSATVWVGVVLAAVAVLLFVVSYKLPGGGRAERVPGEEPRRRALPRTKASGRGDGGLGDGGVGDTVGDDLGDIQAILKRRGIS